jgi:cellulose synthase/poly-beta-1,6-N-acetylglucosamine synthase-like glycosyltransferase
MDLVSLLFYSYLTVISAFALLCTYLALHGYSEEKPKGGYDPKVLVIMPCKGLDIGFDDNVAALKAQSYRNYSIIAVVDSISDPCIPVLEKRGVGHILSKRLGKGSGKTNAIATALGKNTGYGVCVIVDSDVLVGRNWLRDLVAPLQRKDTGLSTAYPYFKSIGGFWSRAKTVWSFVGEGMMESDALRFGWGGSLAFRREIVSDNKDLEFFANAVSDDVAISTLVRSRGMKLAYVKRAQPTVLVRENFASFTEWSNRQTALAMHGNRMVFWVGLPYYALSTLLLFSAILLPVYYSVLGLLLFIPIILGILKNYGRARDAGPDFVFINLIMPMIFALNLIVARNTKAIRWRGRAYRL